MKTLIEELVPHTGTKTKAEVAAKGLFVRLRKEIKKGGTYRIHGFGTFTVKTRAARKGRNPQTGEPVSIKAKKVVRFKAAKAFSL